MIPMIGRKYSLLANSLLPRSWSAALQRRRSIASILCMGSVRLHYSSEMCMILPLKVQLVRPCFSILASCHAANFRLTPALFPSGSFVNHQCHKLTAVCQELHQESYFAIPDFSGPHFHPLPSYLKNAANFPQWSLAD